MKFLTRVKKAIVNFEEYQNFSTEEIWIGVKYFIKLMIIFALVLTIVFTYRSYILLNDGINLFEEKFPDFRVENNELIVDYEGDVFILEDENQYFAVIAASGKTQIEDIDFDTNHEMVVIMLQDRIVIQSRVLTAVIGTPQITYEEGLQNRFDMDEITKQTVLETARQANWTGFYGMFFAIGFISHLSVYGVLTLVDVILISILGFLVNRMFRINLRYLPILNMSLHAITLPVILAMVYFSINMLTGFEIRFFRLAYDAIAYIYILTAIIMIKSDFTKKQMELIKIVEVQKEVKKQAAEEEEKDEEPEKEETDKEELEEKKKKKDIPDAAPEGSQAFQGED